MTIRHRPHGICRNTSEMCRMENRHRGGGNQGRKHPPRRASDTRNPIRQKATQPPVSTLRIGRSPRFRRGPWAPRNRRATRRRHPAFLCGISGRGRFPGRFYEARRPAALVHAELRQECSRGYQSAIPPFAPVSGCAAEKAGSGRRDLVKRSVTFLGFRVSGNPSKKFPEAN